MIASRMKKVLLIVWWIYSLVLVCWLMVLSVISAMNKVNFLFMWLLAPVFLYFTRVFRDKKNIDNILLIYGSVFGFGLLVIDILAIKSWSHGLLVLLLMPLPIYLGKKLKEKIGEKKSNKKIIVEKISNKEEAEIDGKIIDYSKRNFLKFLAGSGVASVVMFLFSKKNAHAAFFGNGSGSSSTYIKNSTGEKVDPAESSPTDGFGICDIGTVSTNNYYGYTDKKGRWYILRENAAGNSFQYASLLNNTGTTAYTNAWSTKTDLTYGNFNDAF
jgi:hypothetical protein